MVLLKLATLFGTLAVISARPQRGGYQQANQYQAPQQQGYQGQLLGAAQNQINQIAQEGMPYNFNWAVNAPEFGNDYSHSQQSDGRITSGEYRVLLPDSRVQIVRFTADENGYVADVSYEGTAQYPQQAASSNQVFRQTSYQQPQQQQYQQQPQQQQYQQQYNQLGRR